MASSSTQASIDQAHESKEVDTGTAGRGVWLVKVPKYLAESWQRTDGKCEVGKLRIAKPKFQGGKPEVVFTIDDKLLEKEKDSSGDVLPTVPKDHKFVLTGIADQNLAILGQDADNRVSIAGKVIQRAECRPIVDSNYMKLKKSHIDIANRPVNEVIKLDQVQVKYKPVMDHQFNIEHRKKKKDEGKRSRAEKDQVMEMLFSAFEKHQYYNLKDLVTITKQPVTYLKEILKEFCTYNTKAPHKNMWELKPEYRHYKEDK
ncbi:general transcription factor IIF subunit 2-like [Lineus longissimus]|uniref:general transcription factor IIF subunit 2-like n=1 Tax=Lineus longissimus TaxID=88925 RepID=UPI002B4D86AA